MLASASIPTAKAVRELLTDLVGRDVTVAPGEPVVPKEGRPGSVAVYVTDTNQLGAVAVADLPLSAHLSAALGLVPPPVAAEAIEAGRLPELLRENLHEVANILAALFNTEGAVHLKLSTLHPPGEFPPADVAAQLRAYGARADVAVGISGYGAGALSLVRAP